MPYSVSRRRFLTLLSAPITAAALGNAGCGGGARRTGEEGVFPEAAATFRVEWPTGNGLEAAHAIIFNGPNLGGSVTNALHARQSGEKTAVVPLDPMFPGNKLFGLSLRSGDDGSGQVLYQGFFWLSLRDGDRADATVTFGTQIRSCSIGTESGFIAGPSVPSHQMAVTARDSRGRIVLTPPGQLVWSSSNPSVATIDKNGLLLQRGSGTVTVSVRDTVSRVQADFNVKFDTPLAENVFPLNVDGLAWVPATRELWMRQNGYQAYYARLIAVDPATKSVVATVPLPGVVSEMAVTGDGRGLFILHSRTVGRNDVFATGKMALSYVDAGTRTIQFLANLPDDLRSPWNLVAAPGASRRIAYLAHGPGDFDDKFAVVFEEGRLLGRFSLGSYPNSVPRSLGWGKTDSRLYAGAEHLGGITTLYRLDVNSEGVTLAGTADDIRFNEARDGLLFGRQVIDGETAQLVDTLPNTPPGRALDDYANGRIYYVDRPNDGTMSIVAYSTETDSVIGRYALPASTTGYGKMVLLSDRRVALYPTDGSTTNGATVSIFSDVPFL